MNKNRFGIVMKLSIDNLIYFGLIISALMIPQITIALLNEDYSLHTLNELIVAYGGFLVYAVLIIGNMSRGFYSWTKDLYVEKKEDESFGLYTNVIINLIMAILIINWIRVF